VSLSPLRLYDTGHFHWIKRGDKAVDLTVTVPLIFDFEFLLDAALLFAATFFVLARLALGVVSKPSGIGVFSRTRWM
jgi:hypothetical protein